MPLFLPLFFLLSILNPPPVPKFEAQVLDKNVSIGYGLAIGDVDGDRKPDILLADQKQIVWYRNGDWKRFVMAENLTERDSWHYRLIDSSMHMTHNLEVLEDQDGTRIWLGGKEGIKVLTSQGGNWQMAEEQPWVEHNFGVGEVRRIVGVNGQPFVAAIEPMHGNQLTIYKPGDTNSRHILKENMNQGHALAGADLLGSGNSQIVVGWRNPNTDQKVGICLLASQDPTAHAWQEYVVDDNTMACEDLQVADLNKDGKLDIIAAGRDSHNLIVYWNRTEKIAR